MSGGAVMVVVLVVTMVQLVLISPAIFHRMRLMRSGHMVVLDIGEVGSNARLKD